MHQSAGSGHRGFCGCSGPGEPPGNRLPPEGLTRSFQSLTLIQGPQELGSIITVLCTEQRPRPVKGFTGTTQQGSPLQRGTRCQWTRPRPGFSSWFQEYLLSER